MSTNNQPPGPTSGSDDANFRDYPGSARGLAPDAQQNMIGGSYRVSTKLSPQDCLFGNPPPIIGDTMPAGAPFDRGPYGQPYTPKN